MITKLYEKVMRLELNEGEIFLVRWKSFIDDWSTLQKENVEGANKNENGKIPSALDWCDLLFEEKWNVMKLIP